MTSDLSSAFQGLPAPTSALDSALVFTAVRIQDYPRHRIGKDSVGAPSLLVAVANRQHHLSLPPIVLEHLTVLHDVDCVVTDADGTVEDGTFTVVRCTGNDRVLNVGH
jgi:hypothetical protein